MAAIDSGLAQGKTGGWLIQQAGQQFDAGKRYIVQRICQSGTLR